MGREARAALAVPALVVREAPEDGPAGLGATVGITIIIIPIRAALVAGLAAREALVAGPVAQVAPKVRSRRGDIIIIIIRTPEAPEDRGPGSRADLAGRGPAVQEDPNAHSRRGAITIITTTITTAAGEMTTRLPTVDAAMTTYTRSAA